MNYNNHNDSDSSNDDDEEMEGNDYNSYIMNTDNIDSNNNNKNNINNVENKPLYNIYVCGSTEDGRLGLDVSYDLQKTLYPVDISSPLNYLVNSDKLTRDVSLPAIHQGSSVSSTTSRFEIKASSSSSKSKYVCDKVSAGGRHTLILIKDISNKIESEDEYNSYILLNKKDDRMRRRRGKRLRRQLCLMGLNQLGLCEEPGEQLPVLIPLDLTEHRAGHEVADAEDSPVCIAAGGGASYVVTQKGKLLSFGNGTAGRLGLGDTEALTVPRLCEALRKHIVRKVFAGQAHALCLTKEKQLFGWGKNARGQVGIGSSAAFITEPCRIHGFKPHETPLDVSCGDEFTVCAVRVVNEVDARLSVSLFGWGDASRGQLGPDVKDMTAVPAENMFLTRFLRKLQQTMGQIAAGGSHVLLLTQPRGQVISFGASDYGQLGHGYLWDDAEPRLINNMADVFFIAAGKRHSVALRKVPGDSNLREVYSWGYNGYGELGLGDTNIRLQPTKLTGDIESASPLSVSCGGRHTVFVFDHRPKRVAEDAAMIPYFKILQKDPDNYSLQLLLKRDLRGKDMDPDLLDTPTAHMPNQTGTKLVPLVNARHERGFRYCLDTSVDASDWRRKVYETTFECPTLQLKAICLSCARQCKKKYLLRPYIRKRQRGDICDCKAAGSCSCRYTVARAAFDKICGDDLSIGPHQLRGLLQSLRAPLLVEGADMEVCLLALCDGSAENATEPRVKALDFEKWYDSYFEG